MGKKLNYLKAFVFLFIALIAAAWYNLGRAQGVSPTYGLVNNGWWAITTITYERDDGGVTVDGPVVLRVGGAAYSSKTADDCQKAVGELTAGLASSELLAATQVVNTQSSALVTYLTTSGPTVPLKVKKVTFMGCTNVLYKAEAGGGKSIHAGASRFRGAADGGVPTATDAARIVKSTGQRIASNQ